MYNPSAAEVRAIHTSFVYENVPQDILGVAFLEAVESFQDILEGLPKEDWVRNFYRRTSQRRGVAAVLATYGGYAVSALHADVVGWLAASEEVVIYRGMMYARDVWE